MLRRVSLTAVLFAGALTLARADVYRWVDPQGQPHYSDQWVPGSQVIKTDKAHPPGAATTARAQQDQKSLTAASERISKELSAEDNARAVQADLAKSRDARCKAAKDAYQRAIISRKVYKDDKDGTRTYLSDAEADAYREQARQAVQDNCGSVPQFDPEAPIPEPQPIDVKPIPEPQPVPEPKVNPADATSR
jgi:Domain of unknown function (DUF4124)